MKYDLYEAYCEVSAVAAIVASIKCQFEDNEISRMNDEYLNLALHGVEKQLLRIAEDLGKLEDYYVSKERVEM